MKRTGKVLADCLRKNRIALLIFFITGALNCAVFVLYGVMMEPLVYALVVDGALLIILLSLDYACEHRAAGRREILKNCIRAAGMNGKEENTLRDRDYTEMLKTLTDEIEKLRADFSAKRQADGDYYTAWVHQIKTPIATMKLLLTEDTERDRAAASELFRIERYVEMVLDYIRLESESSDLVFQEYSLDELIRETLRKFAPQFILRKLKLSYQPTEAWAVTDKKWLTFILEQLIANAVKYTPEGEIRVWVRDKEIHIADTGIGIAPEDLPRIFEKGYTGLNGRCGQQSSGLGLFLTKKAADLLSARIKCESTVGRGTEFTVRLPEKTT